MVGVSLRESKADSASGIFRDRFVGGRLAPFQRWLKVVGCFLPLEGWVDAKVIRFVILGLTIFLRERQISFRTVVFPVVGGGLFYNPDSCWLGWILSPVVVSLLVFCL